MAIDKKTKKVTRKKATKVRVPGPAVPDAIGDVLRSGHFECHLPVQGRRCGARMFNEGPNIRSHISKKHRVNSSYKKNQKAVTWPCVDEDCISEGRVYPNFHALIGHARSVHGMKGTSMPLKKRAKKLKEKMLQKECQEKRKAEREEQANASDDAEYEEEPLFVDPPSRPDGPSGGNMDRDPPGTGGSQPIPVA